MRYGSFRITKIIVSTLVFLIMIGCSENEDNTHGNKLASKISKNNHAEMTDAAGLEYLADAGGKYPHEIKLLETEPLTGRLEKLLDMYYQDFREWWDVEEPIREIQPKVLWAEACKAHECGFIDFALYIDIDEDYIVVGMNTDDGPMVFSEKPDEKWPKKMADWYAERE